MSKKKEIATEEWDFSVLEKAPRTVIHRALQWELDRELGSGREPFLKSAECRRALAAGKGQGSASGAVYTSCAGCYAPSSVTSPHS